MTENGSKARVVGISGPDGGGKGYLTGEAIARLGLVEVPMVTTRPHRGESETKVPLDKLAYDALLNEGKLVGHHENKGHFYAFRASDLAELEGDAIIELNPEYQRDFPKELAAQGIEMVGWIGLHGEPEYLRTNINDRTRKDSGADMDPEALNKKLDMANIIMERQRELANEGVMTMFKVGWDNRNTMGEEIAELIDGMLESQKVNS